MSTNRTNQTDADLIAEITERRRKADKARADTIADLITQAHAAQIVEESAAHAANATAARTRRADALAGLDPAIWFALGVDWTAGEDDKTKTVTRGGFTHAGNTYRAHAYISDNGSFGAGIDLVIRDAEGAELGAIRVADAELQHPRARIYGGGETDAERTAARREENESRIAAALFCAQEATPAARARLIAQVAKEAASRARDGYKPARDAAGHNYIYTADADKAGEIERRIAHLLSAEQQIAIRDARIASYADANRTVQEREQRRIQEAERAAQAEADAREEEQIAREYYDLWHAWLTQAQAWQEVESGRLWADAPQLWIVRYGGAVAVDEHGDLINCDLQECAILDEDAAAMMENDPTGWHTVTEIGYNGEETEIVIANVTDMRRHAWPTHAERNTWAMYCRAWSTSDGDYAWTVNQPPDAPEPAPAPTIQLWMDYYTDRTGRTGRGPRHTWREWSRRLDPDRRQAETEIPY